MRGTLADRIYQYLSYWEEGSQFLSVWDRRLSRVRNFYSGRSLQDWELSVVSFAISTTRSEKVARKLRQNSEYETLPEWDLYGSHVHPLVIYLGLGSFSTNIL